MYVKSNLKKEKIYCLRPAEYEYGSLFGYIINNLEGSTDEHYNK